ncbi:MAG: GNAT family N-acetyltransferase [Demequina sp.]|uniref:GNAT family N-acetyltransferase n=1 Tax=Demequina sp. TaxID=2050685 RepID=UPI003A8AE9B8
MSPAGGAASPRCTPLGDTVVSLEPLSPSHADEMVRVLADPSLYAFTGDAAPSLEALRQRYVRQSRGVSPGGDEAWLNWIIRDAQTRTAVGYVQATVMLREDPWAASAAWLVHPAYQGRGIATRAARLMIDHLTRHGVREFSASIADGHLASERVAGHLGMTRTEERVDKETVWRA